MAYKSEKYAHIQPELRKLGYTVGKGIFVGRPEEERIYRDKLKRLVSKHNLMQRYKFIIDRITNTRKNPKFRKYEGLPCNMTAEEFSFWFYYVQDSFRIPNENLRDEDKKAFEYQLDKDYLNTISGLPRGYLWQQLCFIPKMINSVLEKVDSVREFQGKSMPLGVFKGRNGNYSTYLTIFGRLNSSGGANHFVLARTVNDMTKCFWVYKLGKESYLRRVADAFYRRDLINYDVYQILRNHKVVDDTGIADMDDMEAKNWAEDYLYRMDKYKRIQEECDEYLEPLLDRMQKSLDIIGLSNGTTHVFHRYSRFSYYQLDPIGSRLMVEKMISMDEELNYELYDTHGRKILHKPSKEFIEWYDKLDLHELLKVQRNNPSMYNCSSDLTYIKRETIKLQSAK